MVSTTKSDADRLLQEALHAARRPARFTRHNMKVYGLLWDLPVGLTCKVCCSYCYARKAEWRTCVHSARVRNLVQSMRGTWIDELAGDLCRRKNDYAVRFHSSGDIYSLPYFNKLQHLARLFPERRFWTYTQRDDLLSPQQLAAPPPNFTVISSLPGVRSEPPAQEQVQRWLAYGFRKVAWIADGKSVWGSCPAVADKSHRIKCGRDCRLCIDDPASVVSFTLH
jgi:hypothetical protein